MKDRREIQKRASRDEFQRSIGVRHKRKATPEASSSLGAAASWRTTRDPSLARDFETSYPVFKASRGCLEGGSQRDSEETRDLFELDTRER